MKNTIAGEWAAFEAAVLPKDTPQAQRRKMRRAFYAGAEAMLRLQFGIGDQAVSEDAGITMMECWHEECRQFARQVVNGVA